MKKSLLIAVLGLFGLGSFAQQDIQVTHFMFDKLSVNPGYAGLNGGICATGMFRNQWGGFDGAPKTGLLNVHAPIKAIRGGLGLTYYNDQLGFEKNNIARLHYSYHLGLGTGTLGIGVSAGIVSKSINATWITPDGTPFEDDNSISSQNANGLVPDFSLGVFYKMKRLYMGLSATHLSQSDLTDLNIQTARHYWVMAGYDYVIKPGKWNLMPSILAKSDAASTQLDLNVRVLYSDMIWLGVTYRLGDAVAPMVGFQKGLGPDKDNMLKIGYSYDVTTSQLSNYSNGTHEVMVNFCFNTDKAPPVQIYKNPRFL